MDLTTSYETVFPADVVARYKFRETRNAASVLRATDPDAFDELVSVLREFQLLTTDMTQPVNRESQLAARLNAGFRRLGWREARVDTRVTLNLRRMPYTPAGEHTAVVVDSEVVNKGYKVDNVQRRVALDVEWNAKDGNLDRDLAAYRALYEWALVDVAVMITRTIDDLRALALRLRLDAGFEPAEAAKMLNTTTTTNLVKLEPRLSRGDSGGCPMLAIAIGAHTWEGDPATSGDTP